MATNCFRWRRASKRFWNKFYRHGNKIHSDKPDDIEVKNKLLLKFNKGLKDLSKCPVNKHRRRQIIMNDNLPF